jgi:hypothetical protein
MAQRRHHYEHAFEEYLRTRRIPYVAVDEARKALLPHAGLPGIDQGPSLKSFDFVIYGQGANLLVEVKGRRVAHRTKTAGRLESWVTAEDVESLGRWEGLFGPEFDALFLFVYWCNQQPPDALFQEVFEHRGRWYALRSVRVREYAAAMKVRSPRWGTVDIPGAVFERISTAFAAPAVVGDVWVVPRAPERLPALDTLVGPP